MRRWRRLDATLLVLAVTLAAPGLAWAGDAALAEQLFDEGLAAMRAERWAAACDAFAASNEQDPSPGTQINLGLCHEKQKKFATALIWYNTAARTAEARGKTERMQQARNDAKRVEGSVHKLVITMKTPAEGVVIARGNDKIPATLLDKDIPMDPGHYTFEISARGKKAMSKSVDIPETPGRTTLEFPTLEDAPEEANAGGGAAAVGGDYRPPVTTSEWSGQKTVGLLVAGGGVLALIGAGVVQLHAQNENEKAQEYAQQAASKTDPREKQGYEEASASRRQAAENNELIAISVAGAGVVLLGVGAVLFFTAPSGARSGKPRVVPAFGAGYAGLSFGGAF